MIIAAWGLFLLGITHLAFGVVKFKAPLLDACKAGFVGQFNAPEQRRTAFWFLVCGPLLMALGQLAIHAVNGSDLWTQKVVGLYLLLSGGLGVLAFPRSPLWAPLALSPFFLASGFGLAGS